VARSDAARAVDHRGEVRRPLRHFRFLERNAGPRTHRAAEDLVRRVEQHHFVRPFPTTDGSVPRIGGEVGQPRERLGRHQTDEHLLAVSVRRVIEHLHTAEVLQQRENRERKGALSREATGLVEDACRLGSLHADGRLQQQSRLERIGPVPPAAVADELIPFTQKAQGAVGGVLTRDR